MFVKPNFCKKNMFQGKFWCSTRVDAGGNHVTGTGEWGHCSAACPQEQTSSQPTSSVASSSSSSSSSFSSSSSSSSGQTSSAFTVEGTVCKTRTGVSGTCRYSCHNSQCVKSHSSYIFKDRVIHYSHFPFVIRIPSLCVGASLDYIERNPCGLPAGEEVLIAAINVDHNNLRQGVCCVDISIDNIISIVDAPPVVVDIPNNLDTQGIFLRTDFGVTVRTSAIIPSKNRFTDLKTVCQPSASSRCDRGHKFCGRQRAK